MESEKYIDFTLDYVREEIVKRENWLANRTHPLWGNCPTRVILCYAQAPNNYYLDPYWVLTRSAMPIVIYHGKRTGLPRYSKWSRLALNHVLYYIEYDRKYVVRAERETFSAPIGSRGREFQRAVNNVVQNTYYGIGYHYTNKIDVTRVEAKNGLYHPKAVLPPSGYPGLRPEGEERAIHSADYARLQAEYERHIARLQRNPEP